MAGYKPINITGNKEGLIQSREEFILPHDAYPVLQNAFVWRERVKRKQGCQAVARLRRTFSTVSIGNSAASPWSFNLLSVSGYVLTTNTANPGQATTTYPHGLSNGDLVTISGVVGATGYNNTTFTITVADDVNFTVGVNAGAFGAYVSGGYWISNRNLTATEPNAELEPRSVVIVIGSGGGAITFTDQGDGTLTSPTTGNSGTVNYISGAIVLTHTAGAGVASTATFSYFPAFPVMGIRTQITTSLNVEDTIFFDQVYSYKISGSAFQEYIPGTTWSGTDANFFFSTNYWVNTATNARLFWVTNFSGVNGDPIRYTDGSTWTDFGASSSAGTGKINAGGNYLNQCLAILPFRSRLVAFNTMEGATLSGSTSYEQRIRWSAIGNPLVIDAVGPPKTVGSWRDDIPGRGSFIDIPTSESITAVGFVRDNLVVWTERSTWQLRYTGRSIQPFIIEKINSELGAESAFSPVQFDTSLVGIGDKGVVSCDSYKSERIDVKIPDLVFTFNNENQGPQRVCGFRDFYQRIAYWMYPYIIEGGSSVKFPNRRLIYNYENDSWAIYIDQFTSLGNFQPQTGLSWDTEPSPTWESANFAWNNNNSSQLDVAGGNQQGFISLLDYQVINDPTLSITAITGGTTAVVLTVPNHTFDEGQIIQITGIIGNFSSLNGQNYQVYSNATDPENKIIIYSYKEENKDFTEIVVLPVGSYIGGGRIALRDNMTIQSKKFSFMDEGQNIQVGYIDLLAPATSNGAVTLYVLLNYNDDSPINTLPENVVSATNQSDQFFNTTVPTSNPNNNISGTKYMQRIFCPVRGTFLTFVWAYSPEQMNGVECQQDFQIDAQVIWMRAAGRMTNL